MSYIKIPKDRVAVLIGKGGSTKREIEKRSGCELVVDDGSVEILGEGMGAWIAKDIVQAIARGFNPGIAMQLLNDEFSFELIKLDDFANSEKEMMRKKGRVIGKEGKSQRVVGDLTQTHICVYGKTIGIIGTYDGVHLAKEAVFRLLNGARHASVYRFLENVRGQGLGPEAETSAPVVSFKS